VKIYSSILQKKVELIKVTIKL